MVRLTTRVLMVSAGLWLAAPAIAQTTPPPTSPPPSTQKPPVPKPFPGAGAPPTAPKPATTTATEAPQEPGIRSATLPNDAAPQDGRPPDSQLGNTPIYPGAEYLTALDAGRGQTYYLFGTNIGFEEIVNYYRNVLRDGGRELSRAPAMRQFELGRFDDNTMAYPPSVVVKDYTWNNGDGYLFAAGTEGKRYRTVIQIVPATGAGRER